MHLNYLLALETTWSLHRAGERWCKCIHSVQDLRAEPRRVAGDGTLRGIILLKKEGKKERKKGRQKERKEKKNIVPLVHLISYIPI